MVLTSTDIAALLALAEALKLAAEFSITPPAPARDPIISLGPAEEVNESERDKVMELPEVIMDADRAPDDVILSCKCCCCKRAPC